MHELSISSFNRKIETRFLEMRLRFFWLDTTQCINWFFGLFLTTLQFFYYLADNNMALLRWQQYVNIALPCWTYENTFHHTQPTILKRVGIFVILLLLKGLQYWRNKYEQKLLNTLAIHFQSIFSFSFYFFFYLRQFSFLRGNLRDKIKVFTDMFINQQDAQNSCD